ncbi:hypothetical protein [Enterococcus asini]|uniref:hypothetical protein n=1 Tax=Enterococcus asini TaxID=57732 RepID=UPI0026DABBB1|nr:hypothetical protein [Enterococcus asini]
MPKAAPFGYELEVSLERTDIRKNELADKAKMPKTTLSTYIGGGNLRVDKAVELVDLIPDNQLKADFSWKYGGFIKAMDGTLNDVMTPFELNYFEDKETKEREERRDRMKDILLKAKMDTLDEADKKDLEDYVMQFLDEIIVELTIVFSILRILGMTITEAFNKRMPHWIKKKYMKG